MALETRDVASVTSLAGELATPKYLEGRRGTRQYMCVLVGYMSVNGHVGPAPPGCPLSFARHAAEPRRVRASLAKKAEPRRSSAATVRPRNGAQRREAATADPAGL